jgi:tetratricopeptide (TPR) repeat protein
LLLLWWWAYTLSITIFQYVNILEEDGIVLCNKILAYYDKALAIDPNNVHSLYNKGLTLDNLGNHTEAIVYYHKALAIDPKDIYALISKGLALGNLGNYTGAIEYMIRH